MSSLRRTHIAAIAMATIALMLLSGLSGNSVSGTSAQPVASDTLLGPEPLQESEPSTTEITYRIYDMMAEPFGDWWEPRWEAYQNDIILSEGENANTYMSFIPFLSSDIGPSTQGMIFAPYRYNICASNLTSINVHNPEFFPVKGTEPVAGANVDMSIYFQYLHDPWYTEVRNEWLATGGYYGSLPSAYFAMTTQDGYMLMTSYEISMNREGALEWLGLPIDSADPVAWYASVGTEYTNDYGDWFLYEGDTRLDIAYGFGDNYYSLYTVSRLKYDSGTDEVTLQLLHISWGYEVLMTRWLTEAEISPNHEPCYEDFSMDVLYDEEYSYLSMDAVCQYSLRAVEAEGTTGGSAWAWEPSHIDYCTEDDLPIFIDPPDTPSEYLPYSALTYESRNAGDNLFGEQAAYDHTPYWFNLTDGQTLVIEFPEEPVAGYLGEGLTYEDYYDLADGDMSSALALRNDGVLTLGSYVSGGPDLSSMYYPSWNTLVINGPVSFDNARHVEDGPLYHGAPWIEFNVGSPSETTSLEAYVYDSEGSGPVPFATLILYCEMPDGTYYQNTVSCDSYGYCSATVPSVVVSACVYGIGHAPLYTTIDLTAGGTYVVYIQLTKDLSAPTCDVTSSNDGYVSSARPTVVTGVALDDYIRLMYLEVLQKCESTYPELRYVVFDSNYVFLEPPESVANVPYSVGDGFASIGLGWDATTSVGGWLTHSEGSIYLPTELSANMCEMRGYYTDSEFVNAKIFLLFSESTGELAMAFFYDPYLGEVDPQSLTGTFEPAVLTKTFDAESGSAVPTYDMWTPTGEVCQMAGLTFAMDPVLPTGEYRMLMTAYDFGYNSGAAFVDVLADTEGPTADAGEDMAVSVGDTVVLSALDSYDNVAIESYTWVIPVDGGVTLDGPEASYIFEEPGTYEVLLIVVDVAGNLCVDTVLVVVSAEMAEFEVTKLEGNPSKSVVTWDFSPDSDAVLNLNVKNHGLKRLMVEVFAFDEETGKYVLLWKDMVSLGNSGTIVYCGPSPVLLAGGLYRVAFTPLGDVGTWAMVYVDLGPPPVSLDAGALPEPSEELVGSAAKPE